MFEKKNKMGRFCLLIRPPPLTPALCRTSPLVTMIFPVPLFFTITEHENKHVGRPYNVDYNEVIDDKITVVAPKVQLRTHGPQYLFSCLMYGSKIYKY